MLTIIITKDLKVRTCKLWHLEEKQNRKELLSFVGDVDENSEVILVENDEFVDKCKLGDIFNFTE